MGTIAIAVLTEKSLEQTEGLRVIFREYPDIVENDILTMQWFLDVSKFLYSGGWQVCCSLKQVNQNHVKLQTKDSSKITLDMMFWWLDHKVLVTS